MPASESPIIVSGLARSGTTWMQFFLSQHPRIHVHGQTPNVPWSAWWQWYQRLVAQGQWAAESNRHHGYAIAHYAGSDRERSEAVFKRMLRDYLTRYGPDKPRWGLKWVNLAGDREAAGQLTSLWPDARWVVCIRDPFVTIASTRNTFAPGLDLKMRAAAWVEVCRFAWEQEGGRVVVVQIDRLNRESHAERAEAMRRVLECVGEEPCEETDRFVREWPVVHKVKADAKRTFVVSDEERAKLLEEVPGLRAWITRMGYARFAAVPNGPRDGERPASDSLAMTRERGRCSLARRAARWRLLNKSQNAPGLPGGSLRSMLTDNSFAKRMPPACPVELHVSCLHSSVARNVNIHGAGPWHFPKRRLFQQSPWALRPNDSSEGDVPCSG